MAPIPITDGFSVRSLMRDFCSAFKVFSRDEADWCSQLCEVLKAFLLQKAKAVVWQAGDRAVLYTYGSDGTPLLTVSTYSATLPGRRRILRKGKEACEFLIEQGYIKTTREDGSDVVACILRDPVAMSAGDTALHEFTAACFFFPMLRTLGFTGISVSFSCFDRKLFAPITTLLQQRQGLYYEQEGGPAPRRGPVALQELLDWHVAVPCGAHDVHNSLKWSLDWIAEDTADILKRLHITMESLRNGYNLLEQYLVQFVRDSLTFKDDKFDAEEGYVFWCSLGLEADIAQPLSRMNVWWDGTELQVAASEKENSKLVEELCATLLGVFRFREHTDSRWLTVGSGCRRLVASVCVGLTGLVGLVRESPFTSEYYIHGYDNLNNDVMHFSSIAAYSSHVPDSVLLSLLTDDRIARRRGEIEGSMSQAQEMVSRIPLSFYRRLCVHLEGITPVALRSSVQFSASISGGFFFFRCLRTARQYPWRLCEGNVDENLTELHSYEAPPDDNATTVKIWKLLQIGYPRHKLADGIRRMGDGRWTTAGQEQGHGSASVLHKVHKKYGRDMIAQRALIHMARALVIDPVIAEEEKSISKIDGQVARLASRQPSKMGGRQVFLGDVLQATHAEENPGKRRKLKDDAKAKHAMVYNSLPDHVREEYELRAEERAERTRVDIESKINALLDDRDKHVQAMAVEEMQDRLLLRKCRFDDADLETIAQMLKSSEFSPSRVKELRNKAQEPPRQPPSALVEKYREQPADATSEETCPAWAEPLCRTRRHCKKCLFTLTTDGTSEHFLFLFALKSPFVCCFQPMELLPKVWPTKSLGTARCAAAFSAVPDAVFRTQWGEYVMAQDILYEEGTEITVRTDMVYTTDGLVLTYLEPKTSDGFFSEFPNAFKKKSEKAENKKSDDHSSIMQKWPWAKKYLEKTTVTKDTKVDPMDHSSSEEEPEGETEEMSDETKEALWAILEKKRQEWAPKQDAKRIYFKTRVLGGLGTQSQKGVMYDGFNAFASGQAREEYCRAHGMNRMKSYMYSVYGEALAANLGQQWADRMTYFYEIWLNQKKTVHRYTQEEVDNAPFDDGCFKLLHTAPQPNEAAAAIELLKSLAPMTRA